eukprot:Hpha_TRINITY_DN9596_c0_g1::TRINITY_DN9596_c0_g1_i1::g.115027::m.115027
MSLGLFALVAGTSGAIETLQAHVESYTQQSCGEELGKGDPDYVIKFSLYTDASTFSKTYSNCLEYTVSWTSDYLYKTGTWASHGPVSGATKLYMDVLAAENDDVLTLSHHCDITSDDDCPWSTTCEWTILKGSTQTVSCDSGDGHHKVWVSYTHTTEAPTRSPSVPPTTSVPSKAPTRSPSLPPTTSVPSLSPTTSPTTSAPTRSPTTAPTTAPTISPSVPPTTSVPSVSPTKQPTTSTPTVSPTVMPTSAPTLPPTVPPSTSVPSVSPTETPTTSAPTRSPTIAPTVAPTAPPSVPPTTSVP